MNIFISSPDAVACAQALCDLRLNKMILETGQMLCTAYRHWHKHMDLPETFHDIYKPTHHNHPCNVWLRKDFNNYLWLFTHFDALCQEKQWRTNKVHLTYTKLIDAVLPINMDGSEHGPIDFSFDCSNVVKANSTVHDRYKQCLIAKWSNDNRVPVWTRRGPPIWVKKQLNVGSKERVKPYHFALAE